MLLGDLLARAAGEDPDKAAVIFPGERLTYGELEERSNRVANRLHELGIGPGKRVGILYENSPAAIVFFWGVLKSGAQAVDVPSHVGVPVIDTILAESRPAAVALSKRQLDHFAETAAAHLPSLLLTDAPEPERAALPDASLVGLDEILENTSDAPVRPDRSPRDVGLVIYTSGTTGLAKGVMLSHENLISNIEAANSLVGLTRSDSILLVVPFYFIHGRMQLLTHAMIGGTVAVSAGFQFPSRVLAELGEHGVTGLSGVPYHFTMLMERTKLAETELPRLRYVLITGGALSPAALRRLSTALRGIDIHTAYGQTEAAPRVTYLGPTEVLERTGCAGRPLPGVRVEILDPDGHALSAGEVGEVVVSGPNVMCGYVAGDEVSSGTLDEERRLHTGDLGRLDEEGYLYLVGRRSDMIKTAGERVFPRELEELIDAHPAVADSAVVGIPDPTLGERILALVVLAPGVDATADEIRRACLRTVPFVRAPREIRIVDSLPKTASGKVDRRALRESLATGSI